MGYAMRWRKCASCTDWQYGRLPPEGAWYCLTCRLRRAESAAREMAAKDGPHYARWLQTRGPQGRPRRQ
jgi:hypothetical protein